MDSRKWLIIDYNWLNNIQQSHIRRPCLALAEAGRRLGPPQVWNFAFANRPKQHRSHRWHWHTIFGCLRKQAWNCRWDPCRPETLLGAHFWPSKKRLHGFYMASRNWRMVPCPPLKSLWAAAASCNSSDSETDGWHPVHPSKASGPWACPPLESLCRFTAQKPLGSPKLTDGTLSTPQKPLGSRGRLQF